MRDSEPDLDELADPSKRMARALEVLIAARHEVMRILRDAEERAIEMLAVAAQPKSSSPATDDLVRNFAELAIALTSGQETMTRHLEDMARQMGTLRQEVEQMPAWQSSKAVTVAAPETATSESELELLVHEGNRPVRLEIANVRRVSEVVPIFRAVSQLASVVGVSISRYDADDLKMAVDLREGISARDVSAAIRGVGYSPILKASDPSAGLIQFSLVDRVSG